MHTAPHASFRLTRRSALLGLTTAFTLGRSSLALADAPTRKRLVVVLLRGALDGMAAVTPYGDPALAGWRAPILPPGPGQDGGLLDLGGFFGLHPALTGFHDLYRANQLLPVHAVAGAWRSRSHFEAQDMLELGADHRITSGWLNRVAQAVPQQNDPAGNAVAIGASVPLLLRGPAPVGSWAPQNLAAPSPELYARLVALHQADPLTGPALSAGLRERGFSAETLGVEDTAARGRHGSFPALCAAAGKLLAAPDGPRIAALEIGGWDTHQGQLRRLDAPLRQLDGGVIALRDALGPAWAETVVLVMTEFGRTVRANGTGGTDHGTGTVAFLAGGAVAGGRMRVNWPGLAQANLFENRDLTPTTELRELIKGVLAAHLRLPAAALAAVFPDSHGHAPMTGLLHM